MTSRQLDGVYQKLIRAEEHISALDDEVRVYLKSDPYKFIIENRGNKCVVVMNILREPSIGLSILLGDCLHNLRSSLDYLACEAVLLNHGTLTNKTCFPISDDPTKYAKLSHAGINGMSDQAKTLIEGMQPYHAGDAADRHPLWILYTLSNIDKHRNIHLTAGKMDLVTVRMRINGTMVIRPVDILPRFLHSGVLCNKTEVAEFPLTVEEASDFNVEVEAQGRPFVALNESGAGSQQPIDRLLRQILDLIRQVALPLLEPLFNQPRNSISQ